MTWRRMGLQVFLPRAFSEDDCGWEGSPQEWLKMLVRRDALVDKAAEFFVADVISLRDVEIEASGIPVVAIPPETNMIVMVGEGEPIDQGDTLEEMLDRCRDGIPADDFPMVVDLHCWRHHKRAVTCTFTAEQIDEAQRANADDDAEAERINNEWKQRILDAVEPSGDVMGARPGAGASAVAQRSVEK